MKMKHALVVAVAMVGATACTSEQPDGAIATNSATVNVVGTALQESSATATLPRMTTTSSTMVPEPKQVTTIYDLIRRDVARVELDMAAIGADVDNALASSDVSRLNEASVDMAGKAYLFLVYADNVGGRPSVDALGRISDSMYVISEAIALASIGVENSDAGALSEAAEMMLHGGAAFEKAVADL